MNSLYLYPQFCYLQVENSNIERRRDIKRARERETETHHFFDRNQSQFNMQILH